MAESRKYARRKSISLAELKKRISPAALRAIVKNAWCAACGETEMVGYENAITVDKHGDTILKGACTNCRHEISRLIETGEDMPEGADDDDDEEIGGLMQIDAKSPREFVEYMRCSWYRNACFKETCPICGPIRAAREKHIRRGEDPDSLDIMMEDAGNSLKDVLQMIKADAKQQGIDIENIDDIEEPPEPEDFPLYKEVAAWREKVGAHIEKAEESGNDFWLCTEAGADLLWYRNTLAAKTYRQLCNRWHMENGDEYGEFDYECTALILAEVCDILDASLAQLGGTSNETFLKLRPPLAKIKKNVLAI